MARRHTRNRVSKGRRVVNSKDQPGLQGAAWVIQSTERCEAIIKKIENVQAVQPRSIIFLGTFYYMEEKGGKYLTLLLTHGGVNSFLATQYDAMIRAADCPRCTAEPLIQTLLQKAWKEYRNTMLSKR